MIVGIPKESYPGETRVALVLSGVQTLVSKGIDVVLETGCGVAAGYTDEAYIEKGAKFVKIRHDLFHETDVEFYRKQRELLSREVEDADVVITTVAVPGKKAPVLITEDSEDHRTCQSSRHRSLSHKPALLEKHHHISRFADQGRKDRL